MGCCYIEVVEKSKEGHCTLPVEAVVGCKQVTDVWSVIGSSFTL